MPTDPMTSAATVTRCRYGHPDCIVHPGVYKVRRCPFCEARPGQVVTATDAQAEIHRTHKETPCSTT